MNILIKGMEMPSRCEDCACMVSVDTVYQTACGCNITKQIREIDNNTRPNWCPLVPVPEHGDLIDRDAMIRDIQKSLAPNWYIKERNADMVKFLSLEDTIIPAEEGEA